MRDRVHDCTPTPPMGWNSWDCLGRYASEKSVSDNLEVMYKRLAPVGYKYLVIDIAWYAEFDIVEGQPHPSDDKRVADLRIDEFGRYLPSFTYFPNGLEPLIKRTHELGLKFGVHVMRGIPRKAVELNLPIKGTNVRAADVANKADTCVWCDFNYGVDMDRPGAQEYYDSVMELLASWGIDFVKLDDVTGFPREVEAVAKAIRKCGRDIVLSLSPGGDVKPECLDVYRMANMLRTTTDIWDNRKDLDKAFDAWAKYQPMHDPDEGFWFDLDMIPFGHLRLGYERTRGGSQQPTLEQEERMSRLTAGQKRTFITMRAMAASPLFMGGNLPTTDEESFELLTNKDMVECNQNGIMGRRIHESDGIEVWLTPRRGSEGTGLTQKGEGKSTGWIGVFNRTEESRSVRLDKRQLGLCESARYTLYDVWGNMEIPDATLEREIGPDDVVFIRFEEK